jgi:hypothetical protein
MTRIPTQLPESEQVPYTKQPLWFLGLAGVIIGAVGDLFALSLAAQSIVAPVHRHFDSFLF